MSTSLRMMVWCVLALGPTSAAAALEPNEVLVVANAASEDSNALAQAYLRLRGIPAANLILLRTGVGEEILRCRLFL